MQHIMLDLETLGTDPNALILSMGAVAFDITDKNLTTIDPSQIKEYCPHFQASFKPQEQQSIRTIDWSTVKWWMEQKPEARQRVTYPNPPADVVHEVVAQFDIWLQGVITTDLKYAKLWGNGSSFDCVLLESLYRDFGYVFPFKWWNFRDLRTLRDLAGSVPAPESVQVGIEHDALDDALAQTILAAQWYRRLKYED